MGDAPFIQITAVPGPKVYALDSAGVVWEYSAAFSAWIKLTEDRRQS